MATAPGEMVLEAPRYKLAKETADRLTENYSSPPIPVLEISEANGAHVLFDPFDRYRDEVAGFCDFGSGTIFVNSADPINRQTFTIAHELGHWMLHREYFLAHPDRYTIFPRYQRPEPGNPFEQEANHFAANLLAPKRLLAPIKDAPVSVLAKIFAVSQEMMEIRLKNV
jgi:Zn-dependent peptidase ImmA (M78 family)